MKHLIKDNTIVMSGIPSTFTRENGELFYGGYENMTDLHYEDGWRDEVIPEDYDSSKQYLTDLHYDEFDDVVTYTVLDIPFDLDEQKKIHMDDLIELRKEIAILILQIELTNGVKPQILIDLEPTIRGLYVFAKQEIDALTVDNVREYVLRGSQVQMLLETLNQFL